jgi:Pvc16 N-terminal domain
VSAVATHRGIEATTTAVLAVLEDAIPASGLPAIRCAAYRAADLSAPMAEGVSVYLHNVWLSTSRARPPAGGMPGPVVVVELHYLVIAWAPDSARQQRLLGWAIQTLLATPVLPAAALNAGDEVFSAGEQVTVAWESLGIEQLAAIWQVAPTARQPSGSFVARFQLG